MSRKRPWGGRLDEVMVQPNQGTAWLRITVDNGPETGREIEVPVSAEQVVALRPLVEAQRCEHADAMVETLHGNAALQTRVCPCGAVHMRTVLGHGFSGPWRLVAHGETVIR